MNYFLIIIILILPFITPAVVPFIKKGKGTFFGPSKKVGNHFFCRSLTGTDPIVVASEGYVVMYGYILYRQATGYRTGIARLGAVLPI